MAKVTAEASDLLELATDLARQAGTLVRTTRAEAIADVATKTTPTDVVTAGDRASERLIVAGLRAARPHDTILGEEGGELAGRPEPADQPGGRVRWLVDPIDGTVNYLYGLPQYAVSLAAELDGEVVAGVVVNPESGEEWTAVRGDGAYRAGRRLSCSRVTDLSRTLVATGFSYQAGRRARQAAVITELLPTIRDIRRIGAAALDLCFAAEGRVDAYFEHGLHPWDYAAGALIAREAGLTVSGLRGAEPGNQFLLAAPPAIHQALHDRLVALGADEFGDG